MESSKYVMYVICDQCHRSLLVDDAVLQADDTIICQSCEDRREAKRVTKIATTSRDGDENMLTLDEQEHC